ncbi:MAG: hypothetical protein ACMZ7B_11995 [Balneola sp.]
MIFGLPWFAIIPIVAIIGGLVYAYKEKEMELEAKRLTSTKEAQELRKMIFNLKARVENLESIVTDIDSEKGEISLDEIEIKNDLKETENSNRAKVRG